MRLTFAWDSTKAKENVRKHGIGFDRGAEVFSDPFMLSIYDEEHSAEEDRWITIGKDRRAAVLVLVHTFREVDEENCSIRLISVRRATRKERMQYSAR